MWAKNLNKSERLMGREYFGKKNLKGKWVYNIRKPSKTQEPPCNCLKKKKSVKCKSFNDHDRKEIFRKFWNELCTWNEKRLLISTLVLQYKPRNIRNRKVGNRSRRNKSLRYHLKMDDKILPVCKTMFLTTYGVSQKMVYTALATFQTENIEQRKISKLQNQEKRIALRRKSSSRVFLSELNKVESHFCRKHTSKLYLEPLWQSKMELYRTYEEYCEEHSLKQQCLTTFNETFDDSVCLLQKKINVIRVVASILATSEMWNISFMLLIRIWLGPKRTGTPNWKKMFSPWISSLCSYVRY